MPRAATSGNLHRASNKLVHAKLNFRRAESWLLSAKQRPQGRSRDNAIANATLNLEKARQAIVKAEAEYQRALEADRWASTHPNTKAATP